MKKRSMSVKNLPEKRMIHDIIGFDSEGEELDDDNKRKFYPTEKIDKMLADQIIELGITKKVKKCRENGFYIYDNEKIEAKLETNPLGKIMLLVRPLNPNYGLMDDAFIPFREWAEQRMDIDPKKAYNKNALDIYSAR